jgi:TolB-like protein/DNA-binding winged helix-turn-helix (wHTH) protein/Tfp pilus assembly protein PilF
MAAGAGHRFGQFVLNLDRGCLQKAGVDLALRPKSFEVLRYLVERAGRLVSKDEVVGAVWPNVIVSDDALTQCIRDIRKVLNDDGDRFIRTVQRRGYMFVAETTPLTAAAVPDVAQPDRAPPDGAGSNLKDWTAAIAGGRRGPTAALAVLALVVAGAVAAWALGWFEPKPPATETRLTIAVLPFATQGEDWLGDGIAEDIMTAVSRFRDLTVIGRNSSFRYRGDTIDVRQVGKDLNAHYIVLGSVRRSGDRVRITAQLVDARTTASRWTERYDRPFADVFAIQDDVASKVAADLVAHARETTVARLRTQAPANLEVYELALRGRGAYRTITRDGAVEARALAERAIAIDPNYAPAWEVLASAILQFYIQPYSEHQGTPVMLQQARAAAEKAAALDANFATGQATLGFVLMWAREHKASLEALRKAIELNPNDVSAHITYGIALSFAGYYRESIPAWDGAFRHDPFFPALSLALKAQPYVMLREFEPALRLTRSCAERAPKLFACWLLRAVAAKELGLEDEARAAARRLLEIYPKFTIQRHMRISPWNEADAARIAEYLRRAGLPE